MIIGLGCDIVKVSRFNKGNDFIKRFMNKHFTSYEIKELNNLNSDKKIEKLELSVATKFSGKEAIAKALGCGFRDGITLKDIEILHDKLGKPIVNLYNKAQKRADFISNSQNYNFHLTLSNEKEYANAVAIIETI